jgi:hypothetical protein
VEEEGEVMGHAFNDYTEIPRDGTGDGPPWAYYGSGLAPPDGAAGYGTLEEALVALARECLARGFDPHVSQLMLHPPSGDGVFPGSIGIGPMKGK